MLTAETTLTAEAITLHVRLEASLRRMMKKARLTNIFSVGWK